MSRFSLAGRTAFVTGGSRGIGRAIAIGLAEAGADVALSYREKADEAHNHAKDLASRLRDKFPQSDFTWRAGALVFKLDQGVPVYGIDRE